VLAKVVALVLFLFCIAPAPLAFAQSAQLADDSTPSKSTSKAASEEEVQELRREVAELRAQIQRLLQTSAKIQGGAPHLVLTNAVTGSDAASDAASVAAAVADASPAPARHCVQFPGDRRSQKQEDGMAKVQTSIYQKSGTSAK
jgi:hypothetical protein